MEVSWGPGLGGACEKPNATWTWTWNGKQRATRGPGLVRSCPQTPIISFSIPIFYFTWSETLLLFRPLPQFLPLFKHHSRQYQFHSSSKLYFTKSFPASSKTFRRHQKVSDIAKSVCFWRRLTRRTRDEVETEAFGSAPKTLIPLSNILIYHPSFCVWRRVVRVFASWETLVGWVPTSTNHHLSHWVAD